jgi:hypothetical protein
VISERRGMSIQHPLGQNPNIPKKLDECRLRTLAETIRSGLATKEHLTEVATGFIRLSIKIAASYAGAGNPSKADDFASAGLFGIAYALKKAPEKLTEFRLREPEVPADQHLARWIVSCIHRCIKRFYEQDHVVRVPASTYIDRRNRQLETQGVKVKTLDESKVCKSVHRGTPTMHEIREMLSMSAQDEFDRRIIRLRIQGYTDVEIAEQLDLPKTQVNDRRAAIKSRYLTLDRE